MAYQVVHQEGVFVCNRCAADHLGLNVWCILCRMLLVTVIGFVSMVILAALSRVFLPLAMLIMTVVRLGRDARLLGASAGKPYLVESGAAHLVTRWAIQMRRQEVLRGLSLPGTQVVFLSGEEHRAKLKARLG
jgi:hypothetical protein